MLSNFLQQANIEKDKNAISETHKTFETNPEGDLVITYQDLNGGLLRWKKERAQTSAIGASDTITRTYTRKRLLNTNGGAKYLSEKGQPARLFVNGLHAFNLWESELLVITEGEKKAFVGCANGVPTIGASGIHNAVNAKKDSAGNKAPEFISDLPEIFSKMPNLGAVILLFDGDCREGSQSRRGSFASAVLNFAEAAIPYEYNFTFSHIKEELPKGLDDLLIDRSEDWDKIANDLHDQNLKSSFFSFIRLEGIKPKLINNYFSGALSEDEKNPELWQYTERAFYGGQLEEAELLNKLFASRWKFNATLNRWMRYESGKWNADDKSEKSLAVEVGRKLKTIYNKFKALLINDIDPKEADKKEKAFNSRMVKISGSGYLVGLCKLMESNAVNENDMNRDPYVLNCKNGELNLKTGELTPHNPGSNLSRQCLAFYDPRAEPAHEFKKFISYILEDDEQMITFFQTWAGICLSGVTDWQAFIYAYGGGSNGKSTIAKVLLSLLGDYASMIDIEVIMGTGKSTDDYKIAMTKGSRLVVGSEISKGYAMNEAKIKSITGGDTITARPIFGKPIEFEPTAKYFFYGNHKLTVKGQDEGIWRRIYMTEFMRPIKNKKAMTEVMRIFEKEFSGILNWCFEGFQRFYNAGNTIDKPQVIARATEQYKRESDMLADFIEEELSETPSDSHFLYLDDIFRKYASFCEGRKEDKGFRSARMFKQALSERGFKFEILGAKRKNGISGYTFTDTLPEPIETRGDSFPSILGGTKAIPQDPVEAIPNPGDCPF